MDEIRLAREGFAATVQRLRDLFDTVPEDRIRWSPSPTARSPLALVVHCAAAIQSLQETLDGRTFSIPTMAEADVYFLESEARVTERSEARSLLDGNAERYLAWLAQLEPVDLKREVRMPFDLGYLELLEGIQMPTRHTQFHAAQLEYIQTIYGDRTWR